VSEATYAARWIFPVDRPPIPGGTITIRADKIVAVEPFGVRKSDIDLGDVAIVPGFVNAHTHLDLTGARGQCPPTPDFTQWLRSVIAFRRGRTPEQVQADIAAGIAECLRFGTTLIGDIASDGASWDLLSRAPCRSVVFHELLGLTEERAKQNWARAQDWLTAHPNIDATIAGISPHAPYSVRRTQYSVLSTEPLPITTHLAETQAELELLRTQTGPFVDFLKELGVWDPTGLVGDPFDVIRLLPRGLFVHGNYLDPATPFTKQQSLVICPRTHAAFGHPHHPFPKMNVRVALGTDSLASNPDLDLWAEARFLAWNYPDVPFGAILQMATLNGAIALGLGDITGSLTPGKSADLVALPISATTKYEEPYGCLFDPQFAATPENVMYRGTRRSWRFRAE
jgi:cytosine/adenosine deaminase-related metal-dependent hydrolase